MRAVKSLNGLCVSGRHEEAPMNTQQDKIRDLAHALWLEDGSPDGNSDHYWLKAERQLASDSDLDMSEQQAEVEQPPLLAGLPIH
jgi:hypothetical protein